MMAKAKKEVFSVVKAVKNNARTRLGTPPPVQTIPDEQQKVAHGPVKHKRALADLVHHAREEDQR